MRQLPSRTHGNLLAAFMLAVVSLALCGTARAQTASVTLRIQVLDSKLLVRLQRLFPSPPRDPSRPTESAGPGRQR